MPSKEQLVELMIGRLKGAGWKAAHCAIADHHDAVALLLPEPDAVLTVRNSGSGEQGQIALNFTELKDRHAYACTLYRPNGQVAQERGYIDSRTSALEVMESRGNLAATGATDTSKPPSSALSVDPSPEPAIAVIEPAPRVPAKVRQAQPKPPLALVPKETPTTIRTVGPAIAPPALPAGPKSVTLAAILTEVLTHGTYACRWAELRRTHFAGPKGWTELKDWCAANEINCALSFVESSKAADVQFNKLQA